MGYEILCCRPCLRGLRLCQGSLYWTPSGCWLWLSLCLWLHCRCSRSCCGCCPCCCRCCPCGLRSPARGLRRCSLRWSLRPRLRPQCCLCQPLPPGRALCAHCRSCCPCLCPRRSRSRLRCCPCGRCPCGLRCCPCRGCCRCPHCIHRLQLRLRSRCVRLPWLRSPRCRCPRCQGIESFIVEDTLDNTFQDFIQIRNRTNTQQVTKTRIS